MNNRNKNLIKSVNKIGKPSQSKYPILWFGDVENLLDNLKEEPLFDLVVTSPPLQPWKGI